MKSMSLTQCQILIRFTCEDYNADQRRHLIFSFFKLSCDRRSLDVILVNR
jgi:hypothetical protein